MKKLVPTFRDQDESHLTQKPLRNVWFPTVQIPSKQNSEIAASAKDPSRKGYVGREKIRPTKGENEKGSVP